MIHLYTISKYYNNQQQLNQIHRQSYTMSPRERMQQIHLKIDGLLQKFQKSENIKALQNEIQKSFKQIRQLLSNSLPPPSPPSSSSPSPLSKDSFPQLYKLMIEKQQKVKYYLQYKKGYHSKQTHQQYLKKIHNEIQKINKKINDFIKNVKINKQNKKKKNNYEKNIEFLKYHLNKLEIIKKNLEENKLYSIENIKSLFEFLGDIFVSHEDHIFQEDIQKCYSTMVVLADIKEMDIIGNKKEKEGKEKERDREREKEKQKEKEKEKEKVHIPALKIPSKKDIPKQGATPTVEKDDTHLQGHALGQNQNQTQNQLQTQKDKQLILKQMSLSFENVPKMNDYLAMSKAHAQKRRNRKILPTHKLIDVSVISKMKQETLFIIFYSAKGQNEQYFAAKELKSKYWRYNTKHLNWFKRFAEPTVEMADYQVATYIFFDYIKFSNRKKADFTMRFHQLQDKI